MSKSTSSVCRSKNPANCRFHGVSFYPQDSYKNLMETLITVEKKMAELSLPNSGGDYGQRMKELADELGSVLDRKDTTPEGLAFLKQQKQKYLAQISQSGVNVYSRRITVAESYLAFRDESVERVKKVQTYLKDLSSEMNTGKDEAVELSVKQELARLIFLESDEKDFLDRQARSRVRNEFEKYIETSGFGK
jgi:hypothetical protein